MCFLKHSGCIQKFLTVLKLLPKRCTKVACQHIFWAITARKLLATNVYFTQNFISRWLITRYRTNVSKPNSRANRWTSIFTPLHQHIIGIRFSGNSVGHIQRTITLLISIEIMQNLFSNSSSECVLSKTFRQHPKISCRSKVIVETVTEGHFSTHFPSDYGSWITSHQRIFCTKFFFWDDWSRDIGKIFPSLIHEWIVRLPFLCASIGT